MAHPSTLHDAFLDELRDLYNAEKQLTRALPRMVKAATAAPLADAFETHLRETMEHIERLDQVFDSVGETARGKQCEGIAGILEEGKAIMSEEFDDATMDASLIAAAQRNRALRDRRVRYRRRVGPGDGTRRGGPAAAAEPRRGKDH
jgi:ferritin-like metal-binding protein YciE